MYECSCIYKYIRDCGWIFIYTGISMFTLDTLDTCTHNSTPSNFNHYDFPEKGLKCSSSKATTMWPKCRYFKGETAKACGSFGRWQHQHQNLLRVLVNFNRYRDMDIVRFSNSCDADHYISYVFCFSGSFSGFHELPTRGVSRGSRRNQRRSLSDAGHLGAGLRWHFWIDHSAGCVHLYVPQKGLIPVLLCIHIISTDILFSLLIQYLCSWVLMSIYYCMIHLINQHLHGEYQSYHSPMCWPSHR